jgi:hypothetical protein
MVLPGSEAWYEAAWNGFPGGAPAPWTGAEEICKTNIGVPNDAAMARTYIDTVVGFLAPRMNAVLDLPLVGIEDQVLAQELSIFPNPAQSQIFLRQTNVANPIQSVRMLDLSGRTVMSLSGLHGLEIQLDRNNLPSGVYLLEVVAEKGRHLEKVMLQ